MSSGLHKKFIESLMEIFSNSVLHSQTKMGIFVCGQYYHQNHLLKFTIVDLGIGIRQNLIEKIGLSLPADKAIQWAAEDNNTTKSGPIPGGLGLKLLREFIGINQGRVQIISDTGYREQAQDGRIISSIMLHQIPGTVVNIEINTLDTKSYFLSSGQEIEILF